MRHLLVLLLLAGCATSPQRRIIATEGAPKALAVYSQAVQAGDTLYLAGQIGLDPATRKLVEGGVQAETRRAIENCRAILEAAGFSLRDVVQVQVFLADIGDYQAMNEVYATFFTESPPARAAFAVAALPAGAKVEVLMTAVGDGRGGR
ncbi:MAG TPA: Rid family detoxifying hydrolase [Thermoanaerobaculia bacterium]|nr:Rid family detoxifying hydrolase [Thermoanaerobaculia bacterium]